MDSITIMCLKYYLNAATDEIKIRNCNWDPPKVSYERRSQVEIHSYRLQ